MKIRFAVVLAALAAATVLATMRPGRSNVSLRSVRQLWSDVLRDADQPGMRLTRLTDSEEMRLGDDLMRSTHWAEDPDADAAARAIGVAEPMLPHVRRHGIVYRFHVVVAPVPNAIALPGGQIVVTSGMMDFVRSDSELAEVLGHEIAHIDLRHAVERYQYQYRLGSLVELAHRLATMPFSADQEMDADAEGLRLAIAGGYDPAAAAAVFTRMQHEFPEPASPHADTPAGELAQSLGGAIASYFRTHPPSEERARRLTELAGHR